MTCLGLQWLQTKELKCMKVSVSSRQNLKIPAWDAGWELFPTTGLQGFPAGSSRVSEFFSAGCLRYLVIRGDAQRPVLRGRRLPKGHLSLLFPPCWARWQALMGLSKLFQIGKDTAHQRAGFLGTGVFHLWFYFKETVLCSWDLEEERNVPAQKGIWTFSSYSSCCFHYFQNSVSPNVWMASFSLIHLIGPSLPTVVSPHSIFGLFSLKILILALDSKLTSLMSRGPQRIHLAHILHFGIVDTQKQCSWVPLSSSSLGQSICLFPLTSPLVTLRLTQLVFLLWEICLRSFSTVARRPFLPM